MAEEARTRLMRDIDQKTKSFNRDAEDAQAEFEQEQNKLMQEIGQKMMAVIDKYAKDNGYSLILDVSSPQNPVLYAGNNIDVTQDVVGLFDKNSPAPAAAKPAAPVTTPVPAAPKTTAPPAIRRPPGTVK
jgi:outer membrane protein